MTGYGGERSHRCVSEISIIYLSIYLNRNKKMAIARDNA
ncbi:hypothetical protein APA_3395 [Pseudanabaena sp. lw0831]|nr:hypothetical protein APA_3395 [Pseudanabaena sp. lw0831]